MARAHSPRRKALTTASAWFFGFLVFFPILWTILTSFISAAALSCAASTMMPGSTANGIVTDDFAATASERPSPTKLPPE